jgi:hypothetical protein
MHEKCINYLAVKPKMKTPRNRREDTMNKCDVSLGTRTKWLEVESSGPTLRTTSLEVAEFLLPLSEYQLLINYSLSRTSHSVN